MFVFRKNNFLNEFWINGWYLCYRAGCFWGADALFGATKGVIRTKVGYSGGTTANPTYKSM